MLLLSNRHWNQLDSAWPSKPWCSSWTNSSFTGALEKQCLWCRELITNWESYQFYLFGFETWRNFTLKLNGFPKLQICAFRNSLLIFWAVFLWFLTKVLSSEGEDAAATHDRHCWLFFMLLFASLQRSERKYREPRSTDKTSSSPVQSLIHHYKDPYSNLRPEIPCFLYMKSVITVISFQLEYYFSFYFFFFFAVWWVRFKPSADRWKGKVELLFSPKNFAAVRVCLTQAWWLKTKTGHVVPAGYQRAQELFMANSYLDNLGLNEVNKVII